jgi:hypothetical protein
MQFANYLKNTAIRGIILISLPAFAMLEMAASQSATAATLLEDNFNAENGGSGTLNYFGLANWDVTEGSVDLIGNGFFDFIPPNQLYLDLDGTTGNAGKIESKTTFSFNPGEIIELEFDLAGSQRGDTNSVTVSLGSLFSDVFTLDSSDPFTTFTRSITVGAATSAKLIFDHQGGDNIGLLLDNVKLSINRDTPPTSVPEPTSVLGLLAIGALGGGSWLKRKGYQGA